MLDGDARAAALESSALFADKPVPQFWDGEQLLGKAVTHSLGVPHDKPAWDIYLFYGPEADWPAGGDPPAPAKVIAQAGGVVIGGKGTLPAKGDQSSLPAWAQGRADVVGEQSELGSLLHQIATAP